MDKLTIVSGNVEVDTYANTDAEAMYIVRSVVDHLPVIDSFDYLPQINIQFLESDEIICSHDEFHHRSNLCKYNNTGTTRGSFVNHSRMIITLYGYITGRPYQDVLKDTTRWLRRLSTRLNMIECFFNVAGRDGWCQDIHIANICNPDWLLFAENSGWVPKLHQMIEGAG